MTQEIVRALVNGVWVTEVANQGGGGGAQPGALYQIIRAVTFEDFIPDGGLGQGLSTVFYTVAADEVVLAAGIRVTEAFDDSSTPEFGVADETNSINLILNAATPPGPGLPTARAGLVTLFGQEAGNTADWKDNLNISPLTPETIPVGLICFNGTGNGWIGDGLTGSLNVHLWIAKGSAS